MVPGSDIESSIAPVWLPPIENFLVDNTCSRLSDLIGQTSFVYFHKCAQHLVSTTPLCFDVPVSIKSSHQSAASPDTQHHRTQNRGAISENFRLTAVHRPALNNKESTQQQCVPRPSITHAGRALRLCCSTSVSHIAALESSSTPRCWNQNDCNQPPPTLAMHAASLSERLSDAQRQSAMSSIRVALRSYGSYPRLCLRHCNSNLAMFRARVQQVPEVTRDMLTVPFS
jgi:hypothetical protein